MIDMHSDPVCIGSYALSQVANRDSRIWSALANGATQRRVRLNDPISSDKRKNLWKRAAQKLLFRENVQRPARLEGPELSDAQLSLDGLMAEFSRRLDFDQPSRAIQHGDEEVRHDVTGAITIDNTCPRALGQQSNAKAAICVAPGIPHFHRLFLNLRDLRTSGNYEGCRPLQLPLAAKSSANSWTGDEYERTWSSTSQAKRRRVR